MTKHRGSAAEEATKEMLASIPTRHIDFMRQLPAALATPSYVFVHAGLRPGVPLIEQTDHDLLWIREPFLSEVARHRGASWCTAIRPPTPR